MSEDEKKAVEEIKEWKAEGSGLWPFIILALIFGFGSWGSCDNPHISELEKKVARLEGQMSMIGGKNI